MTRPTEYAHCAALLARRRREKEETTMTTTKAIRGLRPGKALAVRGDETYVQCALRGARYVIECGWAVPEAFGDDPESMTYRPFRGRTGSFAWVGRSVSTPTAAEAARLYEEYRTAVIAKHGPSLDGETIGSVSR